MQVRYLRDVTSPADQVGAVGDICKRDKRTARLLIDGGFATTDLEIPEEVKAELIVESSIEVKYKIDVTSPAEQVGKAGEVKTFRESIARQLIESGYAMETEKVTEEKESKTNGIKQKPNPRSKRSKN